MEPKDHLLDLCKMYDTLTSLCDEPCISDDTIDIYRSKYPYSRTGKHRYYEGARTIHSKLRGAHTSLRNLIVKLSRAGELTQEEQLAVAPALALHQQIQLDR